MTKKSILIATIGTRDLAFKTSEGNWINVGNDRSSGLDTISQQVLTQCELGLDQVTFRSLTQHLFGNYEQHQQSLIPIIIGKLFIDQHSNLEKVYLIVTDQKPEVHQREKDTLYSGKIIKHWLNQLNPDISVNLIYLGENGENPSNFEQVFKWWQKTWQSKIAVADNQPIILCLKGGVGQTSEAARISGLSLHGEQIQFYEFKEDPTTNKKGIPSDYSGPFLGTNYLWDRNKQQALKLLENYNYGAVLALL